MLGGLDGMPRESEAPSLGSQCYKQLLGAELGVVLGVFFVVRHTDTFSFTFLQSLLKTDFIIGNPLSLE